MDLTPSFLAPNRTQRMADPKQPGYITRLAGQKSFLPIDPAAKW